MRSRLLLLVAVLLVVVPTAAPAIASDPSRPRATAERTDWSWPVDGEIHVTRAYVAPAHRYGAGHRGIDLAAGAAVLSPAAGRIAFVGRVAGRPVVTIDHGGGYVTTLEPVVTELGAGAHVERRDVVGETAVGGHARPGNLHFGVRVNGEYVNPLLLVGAVPRAVLLPCC